MSFAVILGDHIVWLYLGHEIVTLVSTDNGVVILRKTFNSCNRCHDFFMLSLVGKGLLKFLFSISLGCNCLSNERSYLSLGLCDSLSIVCICLCHHSCSIGRSILNNLILNEFCLSNNLVVLKIGVSVDGLNECLCFSMPLTCDPRVLSFNLLNLLLLWHLIKLSLFILILTLLIHHKFFLFLLFLIVEDSLIVSELLSFKSVFELEDSSFFEVWCNGFMEGYTCDDASFHHDALVL